MATYVRTFLNTVQVMPAVDSLEHALMYYSNLARHFSAKEFLDIINRDKKIAAD